MGQYMILRFTILCCGQNISVCVYELINVENVPLSPGHQIWIHNMTDTLEIGNIKTVVD